MSEFVTTSATVEREGTPFPNRSSRADVVGVPVLRIERSGARRPGSNHTKRPAPRDDAIKKSAHLRPESDLNARESNVPLNQTDPGGLSPSESSAGGRNPVGQQTAPIVLAQSQTCAQFIADNCKASILRVFPGQFLDVPVCDVLDAAKKGDAAARTARKLLMDNRFKK